MQDRALVKVVVDPQLCVGSTMCIMHDPEAFRMRDDGHAEHIGDVLDEESLTEAAELCPVSAIQLIYRP